MMKVKNCILLSGLFALAGSLNATEYLISGVITEINDLFSGFSELSVNDEFTVRMEIDESFVDRDREPLDETYGLYMDAIKEMSLSFSSYELNDLDLSARNVVDISDDSPVYNWDSFGIAYGFNGQFGYDRFIFDLSLTATAPSNAIIGDGFPESLDVGLFDQERFIRLRDTYLGSGSPLDIGGYITSAAVIPEPSTYIMIVTIFAFTAVSKFRTKI